MNARTSKTVAKKNILDWFGVLDGWIKAMVVLVSSSIILGVSGFIYNNFSPPKVERQMLVNSNLIKSLSSKDSIKSLENEIIKLKLNTVIANQVDMAEDMKLSNERTNKILDELLQQCRKNSYGGNGEMKVGQGIVNN